jgi:hypothetical protein
LIGDIFYSFALCGENAGIFLKKPWGKLYLLYYYSGIWYLPYQIPWKTIYFVIFNNSSEVSNMVSKHNKIVSLLVVFFLLVGCADSVAYLMTEDDCFSDELYDPVDQVCYLACEDDNSCEEINEEFEGWLAEIAGTVFGTSNLDSEETLPPIITYDVVGDMIRNPQLGEVDTAEAEEIQDNEANHQEMWQQFAGIIPAENRTDFAEYVVFTDGEQETMGYVEPISDDPTKWRLALDPADIGDKQDHIHTLIHEYGHVLTLNNRQVPFDEEAYFSDDEEVLYEAEEQCDTFFTGEGCSLPNSYVYAFFQAFWVDIIEESWENETEDDTYAFYERYQDQFVSDYAATNLGEDIAESWTHFVLKPRPAGNSIAEDKVLFFYGYPELVDLRSKILARLYSQDRR